MTIAPALRARPPAARGCSCANPRRVSLTRSPGAPGLLGAGRGVRRPRRAACRAVPVSRARCRRVPRRSAAARGGRASVRARLAAAVWVWLCPRASGAVAARVAPPVPVWLCPRASGAVVT